MTWICSIYQWGDKVAGLSVGCLSQMGVKSRYIGELESPQITYVKAISKLLFLTLPIIITIFTLLSWLIVGRFPIEPWINLMWLHLISITSSSKGHWQCSDQKLCHRRARTWKKLAIGKHRERDSIRHFWHDFTLSFERWSLRIRYKLCSLHLVIHLSGNAGC